mmetsp:Transcript_4313/g.6971  ORF Transcript_4313/g.6971 Transcript_4313/m.6971 type:complete len:100 (-) Transcript_4313:211-510(-)|eukprot:CAMPEP_0174990462 /NCGR_PEP_ID=MMETSP0004_2-20121128/21333_1 /TAXON_ID=420556 /ORGANISM="Ochromonas sp., Strain CCMP1393" /LENGTH=99 /DNA_ID=CAMNT_0016244069 /DNA_START=1204 /DNA_END=1503 /DNA_ORIENTATION=+
MEGKGENWNGASLQTKSACLNGRGNSSSGGANSRDAWFESVNAPPSGLQGLSSLFFDPATLEDYPVARNTKSPRLRLVDFKAGQGKDYDVLKFSFARKK